MRVLSLFDGMACGMLAIQKVGLDVEEYVAYEVDKYAIKTATHNFPMIKECGDVFNADFKQYKGFDYIIGGSPCQHWSVAQKNNRETEASGLGWDLFSQYVRAVREVKPKYFIYENNKSMSNGVREGIIKEFGFEPICINSALVSAQNRRRLYWVGKRNEDGTYSKVDIEQPRDKGIVLNDILENKVCVYKGNELLEPVCVASRGRNPDKPSSRVVGEYTEQRYEAHTDGKTNTLTTVSKDNMIAEPTEEKEGSYEVKNGKITVKGKSYEIKLKDGFYKIRNLTLLECKRLQTVPDSYEFPVGVTQAKKMLGNGWTVDVIAHLLKGTIKDESLK